MVAPSKADGSPWDAGGHKLPEDERRAFDKGLAGVLTKLTSLASTAGVQAAVAATVTAELIKIFRKPALEALAKPDIFGTAQFTPTGSYSSKATQKLSVASKKSPVKEFFANFGTTVCFLGAASSKTMRLRVDLTDKDLIDDDKIATVEVSAADIEGAFSVGKSLPISVKDQDTGQLLFVSLNVTSGDTD